MYHKKEKMVYPIEYKKQIIERMKNEKIVDIAKDTGISLSTLYKWEKAEKVSNNVEKNENKKIIKEVQSISQDKEAGYYNRKNKDYAFKQGYYLFKNKRYEEAKKYFSQSIESKRRKYMKSIFFLGKIYTIERKYNEAEDQFLKYIEIDKDQSPHVRLELGRLYVKEGKYKKAKEQFNKYIEIDKDHTPHARLELGKLYVEEERYEEAKEQFNKYIMIDKDKTPHGRLELGKLYIKEGKYKKAKEEFNKYIEIDKDRTPHARLELGKLYVKEGKYEEAKEQFNKYIEINKDKAPHARLELGRLYAKEKKYEEAKEQFYKYIEIDKDHSPHARLELGKLYLKEEKYEEAKEQFNKYIEIDKDKTPHGRLELGILYVIEGKYEEAEKQLKKCLEIKPKDKLIRYTLDDIQQRKNINEIFEKQINSVTKVNTNINILSEIREKIYLDTIEVSDIERLKEHSNELNKSQYYYTIVAIYEKLGQTKNALSIIKQMETEGLKEKKLNILKERLKRNKKSIYDLASWDEIIGWDIVATDKILQSVDIEQNVKSKLQQAKINEKVEIKPHTKNVNEIANDVMLNVTDHVEQEKKIKKKNIKNHKKEVKEKTILENLSETLKDVIDKINNKYYVKMQQITTQGKYVKKYDKLQTILACKGTNKRAKMELMLVLINEGYRDIVKEEFPKEDYDILDNIIKEFYDKKLTGDEARKDIDEYCR